MTETGSYFAAVKRSEKQGEPLPLRVFRSRQNLDGVQLAEALDNPELLEGSWELMKTAYVDSTETAHIVSALKAVSLRDIEPTSVDDAGPWAIVRLNDFELPADEPAGQPMDAPAE